MTKEVLVKITGSENGVLNEDQEEEIVKGNYYQKDGKHFVIYDVVEGDETIRTTLKIQEEEFEIIRNGSSRRVHIKFKQGESFSTMYHTVAGGVEMGFCTKELVISANDNCIEIRTTYEISMNHTEMGIREIQIKIEKSTK